MPVMRQLVQTLHQWDFRVCGVFLIDSQFVVDCSKFFAGVLTALSAMIQLEIPHINVMSKMDLLNKKQLKQVDRWVKLVDFLVHSNPDINLRVDAVSVNCWYKSSDVHEHFAMTYCSKLF